MRSNFAELLAVAEPYKVEVAHSFNTTGAPPTNRTDTKNSTYVADVTYWQNNNIEFIHIHPQNFFPEYAAQPIILKGELVGEVLQWTCCIHPTVPLPTKYLPSNCQTTCTGMS